MIPLGPVTLTGMGMGMGMSISAKELQNDLRNRKVILINPKKFFINLSNRSRLCSGGERVRPSTQICSEICPPATSIHSTSPVVIRNRHFNQLDTVPLCVFILSAGN